MNTCTKTCFKCGAEKPLTDYYKHRQMKDGHLNKCKDCAKRDAKAQCKSYCAVRWGSGNSSKDWRKRNPRKYKAHVILNNAVRDGKITKQPCESCGDELAQAHHDDYSMPLVVRWLCCKCHKEHHTAIPF